MSQAYCAALFISLVEVFSDRGFRRREWMTHWLSSFPKPLICPLELCFLSALVWLQTPLWWRRITPALFLTERNTLSLRMSLNHQRPENLFMYLLFFFITHMHLCGLEKKDRYTAVPWNSPAEFRCHWELLICIQSKNRIKIDYLICWSWLLPFILVSQQPENRYDVRVKYFVYLWKV